MLKDGEKSLVIGTLVPLDLSPFVLEGGSKPHAAKLVSLANQLIREVRVTCVCTHMAIFSLGSVTCETTQMWWHT